MIQNNKAGRIWGPLKKYLDRVHKDHAIILKKELLIIMGLGSSIPKDLTLDVAFQCYGEIQIKKILLNEFVSHLTFIENKTLSIWPNELYDMRCLLENQSQLCEKIIKALLNKK